MVHYEDYNINDIHAAINKMYDDYLATEYPTPDKKIFNSSYYGLDEDMMYLSPEKATRVREKLEREHLQAIDHAFIASPSKARLQMLEHCKRFNDKMIEASNGLPKHIKKED